MERKVAWESYSEDQLEELEALSKRYIDFISDNKTELQLLRHKQLAISRLKRR